MRKKIPLKDWREERVKKGDVEAMNLFELSVISVMPDDVYYEIKGRIELALTCLDNGSICASREILRSFIGGYRGIDES
ncbi:MAG: hypothetical protein LBK61_04900 [Spirochaetaceae bacterium]|jgi:hypothetical protein|nr:hypothetical protein [Spirochaetaceae bacterium]